MANEKRLIDANELLETAVEGARSGWLSEKDYDAIADVVNDAPTVDAVEVVNGRWVFGTANHREYMKCSECLHSYTPDGTFCYCPNCGAKMRGSEE